jgi:hypothetical protein
MSAMTHLSYHEYDTSSYAGNVATAARGLLKALFAVKPRQAAVVSERDKESFRTLLQRLAADYDRHSPALSAELRFMASRG